MDGNWDYQYRLRTFIDLDAGSGDQRYLFSTATPWSEFVQPETPPIVVKSLRTEPKEAALPKARVKFVFETPLTALLRASLASIDAGRIWEYRIVVRRKLESPSDTAHVRSVRVSDKGVSTRYARVVAQVSE